MSEQKVSVSVKNLFKIFGPRPERGMALLEKGMGKDEIFAETGLTVGVNNIDFSVYEGEIFVVMGLSGSGKSTLVRMINGLIKPTAGNIFVHGKDVGAMTRDELNLIRREKMSMVFQSFALMPHMTVLENAAFGLTISGVDPKERKSAAMETLEQVGLQAYADSYPDELSGGMQQRVGLARGLAVNPSIMLMDEAFSALDPLLKTEMQDELLKLQKENRRTVIFISHDLNEAMRLGDRIAIMAGGSIIQCGTPEEILKHPEDDYVKAFFRGVDPVGVLTAGEVAEQDYATVTVGEDLPGALRRILDSARGAYAYVVDEGGRFLGVVSAKALESVVASNGEIPLETVLSEGVSTVGADAVLHDLLPLVIGADRAVPVVDEADRYAGAISKNCFLRVVARKQ